MLIAGNWKMNTDHGSAASLARGIADAVENPDPVRVLVCPPFVNLGVVQAELQGSPVELGAQNMHEADSGAFTGEVSVQMLRAIGCRYVILGHSERRQYFGETDQGVHAKVHQALGHGIVPIVCVGETLAEREDGRDRDVVTGQVSAALADVKIADPNDLVVAYEPVWAIGTGRTATPDQAQEMHAVIRQLLIGKLGHETGNAVHILYGGSMKPGNADSLLRLPDVGGGLIGGASLKAADFAELVRIAQDIV